MPHMLSKSDFLKFLQCRKYLWLYKNRHELLPEEVSEQQQAIFDQGFAVEEYAAQLLPGAQPQLTARAPYKGQAGAQYKGAPYKSATLYARADFVTHDPHEDTYDIYEVKFTSAVKPEHLSDLAFQKITLQAAGYKIRKTFLVHLNSDYVRQGAIEAEGLLTIEDITADVEATQKEIDPLIAEALKAA